MSERDRTESSDVPSENRGSSGRAMRYLWIVAGTVSLAIGVIGVAIPLLPTTPFLLLAAACYMRGSKRMHRWLMNNRVLGQYIRNYAEGRGVSVRFKIFTIALLWITILFTAFIILSEPIIQTILVLIAVLVSIHVARIKTLKVRK